MYARYYICYKSTNFMRKTLFFPNFLTNFAPNYFINDKTTKKTTKMKLQLICRV
jgi:hypothetical protein